MENYECLTVIAAGDGKYRLCFKDKAKDKQNMER